MVGVLPNDYQRRGIGSKDMKGDVKDFMREVYEVS